MLRHRVSILATVFLCLTASVAIAATQQDADNAKSAADAAYGAMRDAEDSMLLSAASYVSYDYTNNNSQDVQNRFTANKTALQARVNNSQMTQQEYDDISYAVQVVHSDSINAFNYRQTAIGHHATGDSLYADGVSNYNFGIWAFAVRKFSGEPPVVSGADDYYSGAEGAYYNAGTFYLQAMANAWYADYLLSAQGY